MATLSKELSKAEIKKVFASLYGSNISIANYHQLKGGVFNSTYLIKTNQDSHSYVLRVAPQNKHLLFDFEKSMMSAEPHFYRLLHDKGIPTSNVVKYDSSRRLISREYIIFDYIPSVPMSDSSVPEAAKPNLYRQLGELIAALHEIESDKFGWYRPDNSLPMQASWGAFLHQFAQEIADKAAVHALFNGRDLTRFLTIFANQAIFNQITQPHMVHADLWEGNVLVNKTNGQWEVVALIDIDKAIFGDPAFEFAAPSIQHEAFWHGYGVLEIGSVESRYRQQAYRLLSSFMYAYIWFVQFENLARFKQVRQEGLAALAAIEKMKLE